MIPFVITERYWIIDLKQSSFKLYKPIQIITDRVNVGHGVDLIAYIKEPIRMEVEVWRALKLSTCRLSNSRNIALMLSMKLSLAFVIKCKWIICVEPLAHYLSCSFFSQVTSFTSSTPPSHKLPSGQVQTYQRLNVTTACRFSGVCIGYVVRLLLRRTG